MKPSTVTLGLRLPDDTRQAVSRLATLERRSLNAQITVLVERGLRSPETKMAEAAVTAPAQ